jgi:hypothetical protein
MGLGLRGLHPTPDATDDDCELVCLDCLLDLDIATGLAIARAHGVAVRDGDNWTAGIGLRKRSGMTPERRTSRGCSCWNRIRLLLRRRAVRYTYHGSAEHGHSAGHRAVPLGM